MDKPYEFNELSDVKCTVNGPDCKKFIKKNVLHRKPGANTCFKCTPEGKRDAARKKARKARELMEAAD